MSIKQVFIWYDSAETEATGSFAYCPRCGAGLELIANATCLRPTCPLCGFVQFRNPAPTVSILVVDGAKVLLGRRVGWPGEGKWALPSGYIEYGDDFLTTAIQEVREETGLDIEITAILNVVSSFLAPGAHFLAIFLLAHVVGGELAAADDLDAVDWFPLEGPLPQMAFEEDVYAIEMVAKGEFCSLPVELRFARQRGFLFGKE